MVATSASTSSRHLITFYFDVVSPWSRVAFETLRRYRSVWNADIDWQPVNLGYVMKWSGNKPPITVANKGIWMNEDMQRAERFYNVTLNRPSNFPVNTFFAQSVLRVIKTERPAEELERAIEAFYDSVWTEEKDVTNADVLVTIVKKAGVLQGDQDAIRKLVERGLSKESRTVLANEAKDLVEEKGAFGAPWIVVKRKSDGKTSSYFGSDRTEMIAAFLHEPYRGPQPDQPVPKL